VSSARGIRNAIGEDGVPGMINSLSLLSSSLSENHGGVELCGDTDELFFVGETKFARSAIHMRMRDKKNRTVIEFDLLLNRGEIGERLRAHLVTIRRVGLIATLLDDGVERVLRVVVAVVGAAVIAVTVAILNQVHLL